MGVNRSVRDRPLALGGHHRAILCSLHTNNSLPLVLRAQSSEHVSLGDTVHRLRHCLPAIVGRLHAAGVGALSAHLPPIASAAAQGQVGFMWNE